MKTKNNISYINVLYMTFYIIIIYLVFFFIKEYLIYPNCSSIKGGLGPAGYFCSGYTDVLNRTLPFLMFLLLWIPIVPYILHTFQGNKYKKNINIFYHFITFLTIIILISNVYMSLKLVVTESNLQPSLLGVNNFIDKYND